MAEKERTNRKPRGNDAIYREMAEDIASSARFQGRLLPNLDEGVLVKQLAEYLLDHVGAGIARIESGDLTRLVGEITTMRERTDSGRLARIYLYGEGRSGLVAKAFGMRLVHLGITTFIIGEATTPAKAKGDLLILLTGSGETKSCIEQAASAKNAGARVVAITSFPDSSVGKLANLTIKIEGRPAGEKRREGRDPVLPMGTLFEVTARVVTDAIVERLMTKLGETEENMKKRHFN